ncbi:MAG: mechanosensitive ion channel [Xanthomonadales bacterium]|nr:mechanosensitive ion channel [Xanthomonadales bacterium]
MFESIEVQPLIEQYAIPWGIALAQAVVIFVVGRWIALGLVGLLRRIMNRSRLDETLVTFLTSILKAILLLVVIIAALNELGVNTTSLVALIGAAGLAIGLALQGSLQNFSSGALLVLFKPIAKDEFVEIAGVSGTVEEIHIFHTVLRTPDNKQITIPNAKIFNDILVNYSRRDTRRVDMVFGIGYDDDIDKARGIIEGIIAEDERVLEDPAPVVKLNELADSSVNFVVRPWVNTADYWPVKWDVTEKVKKAFDEQGVSIPFPQRDLHVYNENAA